MRGKVPHSKKWGMRICHTPIDDAYTPWYCIQMAGSETTALANKMSNKHHLPLLWHF